MAGDVPPGVQATAYLAAACRTAETRRPAPRLRDDLAHLFVAARPDGVPDYAGLLAAGGDEVVARTVVLDAMVLSAVAGAAAQPGGPVLVNLGAGLCTRPYRLDLSGCRLVVEVDAPELLAVKERILAPYRPACPVRRVGLDVRDHERLAAELAALDAPVVVVTEGLLPYLPPAAVADLARTLARALRGAPGGALWLADVVSAASAEAMAALARAAGADVRPGGLQTLEPLQAGGWAAVDYRVLPVPWRGPPPRPAATGPASHQVVDGVVALRPDPAASAGSARGGHPPGRTRPDS